MGLKSASEATRRRLLEAAARVFAERGFRSATVRDIARHAQANLAAVNYHFRDKAGLYAAVLRHTLSQSLQRHPPDGGLPPGAPPEKRLHAFVLSLLRRVLETEETGLHGPLMVREMVDPTPALDVAVEHVIRPLFGQLVLLVRELSPRRLSHEASALAARSIVAQCLFYRLCAPVLARLEALPAWTPRDIERVADHITEFSLRGLRGGPSENRP